MGLCDGDWISEIKFDKKEGDANPAAYASDGMLHICPSVNEEIRGQQTVAITKEIRKTFLFEGGSCVPDGERFEIKYSRDAPNEETYHYEGSGWAPNNGNGPAFINGRVTVTSEGGASREGTWEAVRFGGRSGHGPGEEGKGGTHEGTGP